MTHPEGWTRIEADPAQAVLLEQLHPELAYVCTEALYVGRAEGVTGALLAERGEELAVRSIGNNVARVECIVRGQSALVQLAELAEHAERLEVID